MYVFVHFDVNAETEALSSVVIDAKTLAEAIVFLKHHPCIIGAIYENESRNLDDLKNAKLVAFKRCGAVEKIKG